ncbi:MAG: polysaccharide export protein [Burkholderiaceae bacterium]|nr:polysaccharide export protein [Burkholderiaceae bacterium]
MHPCLRLALICLSASVVWLSGCSRMPTVGPSRDEIRDAGAAQAAPGAPAIQIIAVDQAVAHRLQGQRKLRLFSESLGQTRAPEPGIGAGDTVEVNLWEAPPAALFGSGLADLRGAANTVRAATLPEQVVDRDGFINVPFAGRIRALGLTPPALEMEIVRRLKGKANQPEALVRVLRNTSNNVTVVGDVTNSVRMPLTAGGERLLDALAAAGGVRQPVSKMTLQVTRGDSFHALPLDTVIRDPKQNVPLRAGDVITALFQPFSFTSLGTTGKNEEISFEAQGISLAQALARTGGLVDSRSDPQGVFIFRLEQPDALEWPRQPVATTPDGLVPVVYRFDLNNPASYFVMQNFAMNNRDVLYTSTATAAELQKFLNLVFTVLYPLINVVQISR